MIMQLSKYHNFVIQRTFVHRIRVKMTQCDVTECGEYLFLAYLHILALIALIVKARSKLYTCLIKPIIKKYLDLVSIFLTLGNWITKKTSGFSGSCPN